MRFSSLFQTDPGAHTASCAKGTVSFPAVKRPGPGVYHPPPSTAEVKESVELYIHSHLSLHGLFCGEIYLLELNKALQTTTR
jgi:hypothetical protein